MSAPVPSATFVYPLPEYREDAWMALNSPKMYGLIWDIDQKCRRVLKHEDHAEASSRHDLAQEIRSLIGDSINLDEVS